MKIAEGAGLGLVGSAKPVCNHMRSGIGRGVCVASRAIGAGLGHSVWISSTSTHHSVNKNEQKWGVRMPRIPGGHRP